MARLATAEAAVDEFAEPYDVTVQAVSKHLRVLEDAGLVSRSRDAQRREAEQCYRHLDDVLRSMPDDVEPVLPNPTGADR